MSTQPIYFDATRLRARLSLGPPTGIDRVDLAYLHALRADARVNLHLVLRGLLGLRVLPPAAAQRLVDAIAQRWATPAEAEQPQSLALRRWLESAALTPRPTMGLTKSASHPAIALRGRAAIVHEAGQQPPLYLNTSHGQLYRASTARWLQKSGLRGVFFVHDLIPLTHPHFSRAAEPARHAARLATIAAHASHVLVNSAATQASLQSYWQAQGVAMPRIAVAPLGISLKLDDHSHPLPQAAVPYFVMLGTIEPRKNHALLLKLWRRMIAADALRAPRLVLVGRRGWLNRAVFDALDGDRQLSQHVIECEGLDDAALLALLRGARALLNPSFAEGYGLPVAEALAAGVPVLASDLPAHREVGGGCANYLDPRDDAGWLQAITAFAAPQSSQRDQALQRLRSYQPPTWQAHFAGVFKGIFGLLA